MPLSQNNDVDVLVVGAGPVGLTMASELRRHGVTCRIIDQSPEPATSSRALGVFNRTLEAFGQMGIANEIEARGQKAQQMNVYAAGKHLAGFQFVIHAYETPYEYPLFCSQVAVEQVLTKHLAGYEVQVERGVELLSFTQDASGVLAHVRAGDGHEQAGDTLLDSYSAERKPVADRVLNGALTFTRIIGRNNPSRQYLRNLLLRTVNTVPALHRRFNQQITTMLSELDLAYKSSPIIAENWQTISPNRARHADFDAGLVPGMRVPDIHFGNDQELFALMKGTLHTALLLTGLQPDETDLAQVTQLAASIQQQ